MMQKCILIILIVGIFMGNTNPSKKQQNKTTTNPWPLLLIIPILLTIYIIHNKKETPKLTKKRFQTHKKKTVQKKSTLPQKISNKLGSFTILVLINCTVL